MMDEFIKVGDVKDFPQGRGRAVDLLGETVAVFNTGDRFVAFTDACRHMGASLSDGMLSGNDVVCGWHGWRYDTQTGRNDTREWACLTVYEVKVEGGAVFLRRPAPAAQAPERVEEDDGWMKKDPDEFFKR